MGLSNHAGVAIPARAASRPRMSDRTFVALLIAPAALFFVVFVIYPLGLLIFQSFQNVSLLRPTSGTFVGLSNYARALSSPNVLNSAGLTLVYTFVTLGAEFLLGLASALLFNA